MHSRLGNITKRGKQLKVVEVKQKQLMIKQKNQLGLSSAELMKSWG
jgi:hypothetical protein